MTDPFKAALDAAEREPTTAGKIAAFLRGLPDDEARDWINWRDGQRYSVALDLAAAVEKAARND